jgi:elongation factor Tu
MTKFAPSKPFIRIGSVGESGHGKKTLTAAITSVLAKQGNARAVTYDDLLRPFGTRKQGSVVILWGHPEYETATRHYRHVYLADDGLDYVKRILIGIDEVDGLILLVSLIDGVSALYRDHLRLARQVGVSSIVVFLNKADSIVDPERVRSVEREVRSVLNDCNFAGNEALVIVGSALKALEGDPSDIGEPAIFKLLDAMDAAIPTPDRDIDKPFLMAIEDVFNIASRGTILTGRVERGILHVGDAVEVVGMGHTNTSALASSIEIFRKAVDTAQASDYVGIIVGGVETRGFERGQVLAAPGSTKPGRKFEALAYFLTDEEGGHVTEIRNGSPTQFYFRTTDIVGSLDLPDGLESVKPGEITRVICTLNLPIALEIGLRFAIRDEGRTVGVGCLTEIHEFPEQE